MKYKILIIVAIVAVGFGVWYMFGDHTIKTVTSFEECASFGNRVFESYPRRCVFGKQTFIEKIGSVNESQKTDLIKVDAPASGEAVKSPLVIKGTARGKWYFEGSFAVRILDANGKELAVSLANAKGEWMTNEFVPFEATLAFEKSATKTGVLIFNKENPSGLPENDDTMIMPVTFAEVDDSPSIAPYDSGISGTVMLGPTCPVMRVPPDPQCADRPYVTSVIVRRASSDAVFSSGKSDEKGAFKFSLPPGSYTVSAGDGKMLPRCNDVGATVSQKGYAPVAISCDTGIR